MKTFKPRRPMICLTPLVLATLTTLGCRPESTPEGVVHLRATQVLRTPTELVVRLDMQSSREARYRLKEIAADRSSPSPSGAPLTRADEDAPGGFQGTMVLLASYVSPRQSDSGFLKVVVRRSRHDTVTTTFTLPKDSFDRIPLQWLMDSDELTWPLDKPLPIARLGETDYELTVSADRPPELRAGL